MSIVIEYEKTFERGVKGVRIVSVDALTSKQTPKEYTWHMDKPYAMLQPADNRWDRHIDFHPSVPVKDGLYKDRLFEGEFVDVVTFSRIVNRLVQCGNRLKRINDRIRAEKRKWHGRRKVII